MSGETDDIARSLYNGVIPAVWRRWVAGGGGGGDGEMGGGGVGEWMGG